MTHHYKLLLLLLLGSGASFGQNIGISGTTNPQYPLDVNGQIRIRQRDGNGAGLWFNKPDNTLGSFIGQTSTGNFGIANNSAGNWSFVFDYQNKRFGIGTDAPTSPLTIKQSGLGLEHVNSTGTVSMGTYVSSTSGYIQTNTNHPLRFATNNANAQLTLSTNGNLGIGTLTPNYPLSFTNTVGDKISLWTTDPSSATAPHYGLGIQGYQFQLFAPTTSDNIVFGVGSSANFTERVRFTGDGKVGIGTDNPGSLLTLMLPAAGIGLDQSNSTGTIRVGTYVAPQGAFIRTHTNSNLNFSTNGSITPGMILTTSGNVGIGNTAPGLGGLIVDKKVGAVNALFGGNTTGVSIESDYPGVAFNSYYNGGRKAISPGFGGGIGQDPTTGRIYIYNSSTSIATSNSLMPVIDRISILANGNVGIGNTNPGVDLDVSGNTRLVGDGSTQALQVFGGVKAVTGDQGEGKVLTSDANGVANWRQPGYGAVEIQGGNYGDGSAFAGPFDLRNNADVQINLPEVQDDDGRYTSGSYTVGQTGYYLINGMVDANIGNANNAYYFRYVVKVFVNNTLSRRSAYGDTQYSTSDFSVRSLPAFLNTVFHCNAGDVITFKLNSTNSSTQAEAANWFLFRSQLTITKL